MENEFSIAKLREVISENLRVQKGNIPVSYISVGTALQDAKSRQNHTIFARRGCGKTLLLHHSAKVLLTERPELRTIYLNCEDFKRHSFPNVLIEILSSLLRELDKNINGWFGKKKKLKELVKETLVKLKDLQISADQQDEEIRRKNNTENTSSLEGSADLDKLKISGKDEKKESLEIERSFKIRKNKLQELDLWLPRLKENLSDLFENSNGVKGLLIQLDDLYHLKRVDQAFVVDYARTYQFTSK